MRIQTLVALSLSALASLTLQVVAEDEAPPAEDVIDQLMIVEAGNQFALDAYTVLGGGENLALCPHSLMTTLTMTYLGAGGATARQHERALHLEGFERDVLRGVDAQAALQYKLRRAAIGREVEFTTDSMVWVQSRLDINEPYRDGRRLTKLGGFEDLDFYRELDAAVARINRWADVRSAGRIKPLIDPGDLPEPVLLVLTNVVYFKGAWQVPFDPADTTQQTFHVSETETVRVPMMSLTHALPYHETESVQILELPYAHTAQADATTGGGGGLMMDVVLPKHPVDLAAVEKKLRLSDLNRWLAGLRPTHVALSMPRFTARTRSDLADAAPGLGLSAIFQPSRADFSGIFGEQGDLWVGMFVHESVIEVTEQGTEAAGGSGVGITTKSDPGEPTEFRADRPFIYLIRDRETGAILFIGRVTNPTG